MSLRLQLQFVPVIAVGLLLWCTAAQADFFTPETIQRFAPLLVMQRDEDNGPAGAQWFLDHSTLKFAESDPCSDETVYGGPWSETAIARLGPMVSPNARWLYRNKLSPLCHHSGATYSTTDPTRPFDSHHTAGLDPREGFFLNFAGPDSGVPFSKAGENREFKSSASIYYDDGRLFGGEAGRLHLAYITYWFFYAYNDAPPVKFLWNHQGDWEDMSLLFEQSTGDSRQWILRRVAYAAHGKPKVRTSSCPGSVRSAQPLNCPVPRESWRGMSRLVGFVANGDHATYSSPGPHPLHAGVGDDTSPIGSGFAWPTWQTLLSLEVQPWAGFCGAWGTVGGSLFGTGLAWAEDRTGPLGPGCLGPGERQLKTGRPGGWGRSKSSSADKRARSGHAIGVGL